MQHALLSQVLTPAEHRDSSSRNVLSSVLFPQFIQPSGSPATEVMTFSLPHYCLPWLPAVAHYLRQNLLIFLHVPKYTDSNTAHHFKVTAAAQREGRRGGGVSAAAPASSHRPHTLHLSVGVTVDAKHSCACQSVTDLEDESFPAVDVSCFSTSFRWLQNSQTSLVFCMMSTCTKLVRVCRICSC